MAEIGRPCDRDHHAIVEPTSLAEETMQKAIETISGLTWDHPRGFNALNEAARLHGSDQPLIRWHKQPLEGFESAPISSLAAKYDLVVLDHPHVGEAVAENCLIPIDELFAADHIDAWRAQTIGPALSSYHFDGNLWALPLDVATQLVVRRADVFGFAPAEWDEVTEMAARRPVALSVAGPHAILSLFSLAGSWGFVPGEDAMLPDSIIARALELMAQWYERRPKGSEMLNPIAMSEIMAASDDIALVPLMFGYVNYARPVAPGKPLAFSDTPRQDDGYGGILGGTGVGFSRRKSPGDDILDHVVWLMDEDTQTRFMPHHDGQPSARAAWEDEQVNADWGGFYEAAADTARSALLRPRFDGYVAFQAAASATIRDALENRHDPAMTIGRLRGQWRNARQKARGPLDDDRLNG